MNFLLFDPIQSSLFNANFISKHSPKHNRYQYFIQRLGGVPMESEIKPDEGKQWVAYINDIKTEWDEICDKEKMVKPSDNVQFRFELISK